MFTDVAVFTAKVWLFQFAFLESQSVSTQVYFSFVCSISKIHSILFVFVVCNVQQFSFYLCIFDRAIQSFFFFFFFGGGGVLKCTWQNKSTGSVSVFALIQMSW